jgi:hypothetical protein
MNWRQLKDRGPKEARGEMVIFFLALRAIMAQGDPSEIQLASRAPLASSTG